MNRKIFTGLALFILCVMTLSSCYDKDLFDSDKISESVEWQPNWIIPVGHARYEIWDLIDQHDPDADIRNIDNVITLVHKETDILQFKANEIIDIPVNQASQQVGIVVPDEFIVPGYGTVSKNWINGINITEDFFLQDETGYVPFSLVGAGISLDKLFADFSLRLEDTNVPFRYIIDIEFPGIIVEGSAYKVRFYGDRNNPHSEIFNLSNGEINFGTNNSIEYKVIVTIPAQEDVSFVNVSNIDLNLTLENIVFNRAEGDFGNMSINIGNGNFDIDVDIWDDLDGDFVFADPKIELIVHNHNVGVPFKLDADFIGYNKDGRSVNIKNEKTDLRFNGISTSGDTDITEEAVYDNTNSNIVDLFALPPNDRIEYSGFVNLNPDGPGNNFITGDAAISLDAAIEVPLHFYTDELTFRDTITDLDLDLDSDDTDNIEKAGIVISYKSEIPLDVNIDKIIFLDGNMLEIASLSEIILLESPQVDDSGNIVNSKESVSRIELTDETIDKLDETMHIEIVAKASTSGQEGDFVKIPADAIIDFNIAFEVKLDLSNQ